MASSDSNESFPPSFYCPISQQVMHDPVVLSDGHSYEKRHIERWLSQKQTSPVTGQMLDTCPSLPPIIFPNHALRNAIEEYFKHVLDRHRLAIRDSPGWDSSFDSQGKGSFDATELSSMTALMQMSMLVNADLSAELILNRIVDQAKQLVEAEVASVFLVDRDRGELYSTINSTGGEIRIPITTGIAGVVATTGEAVLIPDAYCDSRFNQDVDKRTGFKTTNILCVPIKMKSIVIGVAQFINKRARDEFGLGSGEGREAAKPADFTSRDQAFMTVFSSQAAATIAGNGFSFEANEPSPPAPNTAAAAPEANEKTSGAGNESSNSGFATGLMRRFSLDRSKKVHPAQISPCGENDKRGEKEATIEEDEFMIWDEDEDEKGGGGDAHKEEGDDALSPLLWDEDEDEEGEEEKAHKEEGDDALSPLPLRRVLSRCSHDEDAAEVKLLLEAAHASWECDVLALDRHTGGRALSTMAPDLLARSGLVGTFRLAPPTVRAFFARVELGYDASHAYHNGAHAAAVLHHTHALLRHGGVARLTGSCFGEGGEEGGRHQGSNGGGGGGGGGGEAIVTLAGIFAAAVHDYEHKGVTNDFLEKTGDERAVRYNNRSPNENHHAAAALALLTQPELNFLSPLPVAQVQQLRRLVIELVLATDMAQDKSILRSFEAALGAQQKNPAKGFGGGSLSLASAAPGHPRTSEKGGAPQTQPRRCSGGTAPFMPSSEGEAMLCLFMTLKCADLGHMAAPWDEHQVWLNRLELEFFAQGDREKAAGLPCTFLCDRDKLAVTEAQVGFFSFVALPLFVGLGRAAPDAMPLVDAVRVNLARWQEIDAAKARDASPKFLGLRCRRDVSINEPKEDEPAPLVRKHTAKSKRKGMVGMSRVTSAPNLAPR